jgi:hypothetical protein
MPRKKSTATPDAPTAVETEAITDAVEAAVEELENDVDNIDAEPTPVVACIGEDCEQFGHDKADRDVCLAGPITIEGFPATDTDRACIATPQPKVVACIRTNCQHFTTEEDEEGEQRYLCAAIPDEPPTELDFDLQSPDYTQPCVAPTLMVQVEAWEKLVEHDNGQLAVDVDTDDDVRDQVRERLFNDVLHAQDAVSKAVDKLGDARQAQRAAEAFLAKYDTWQADVTATITELKAELREQVSDVNDTSLSDEDVNQDEVEGGESDDTYPGNMLEPGDMGYPEGDDPGEEALANEEPVDAES